MYGLEDPDTKQIRYVGKTFQRTLHRFYAYSNLRRESSQRTHKGNWLRQLHIAGKVPRVFIIEELPETATKSDLDDAEKFWIAALRLAGAPLTNGTDGGEGWAVGERNPMNNPEAKERWRTKNKGRKLSDEQRKVSAAAAKRRYENPEFREKMSAALRARNASDDSRERTRQLNYDRWWRRRFRNQLKLFADDDE